MRARSRSRRRSPSASPIERQTRSASSSSRSRAASTPAAITTPATSASSASTGRASRTTSCCSAARKARTPRSATITGPGFDEDGIVDAIEKATDVYLASAHEGERFLDTYRRSAWPRSRRRSMVEPQLRFRDDEPVSDPAVTRRCVRRRRPTPPRSASSRATMLATCSRISTGCGWSRSTSRCSATAAAIRRRGSCARRATSANCARSATCWSTSWSRCAAAASTASRPTCRWTPPMPKPRSIAGRTSTSPPPTARAADLGQTPCALSITRTPRDARRSTVIDTRPRFTEADAIQLNRLFRGTETRRDAVDRAQGAARGRCRGGLELRRGERGAAASGRLDRSRRCRCCSSRPASISPRRWPTATCWSSGWA